MAALHAYSHSFIYFQYVYSLGSVKSTFLFGSTTNIVFKQQRHRLVINFINADNSPPSSAYCLLINRISCMNW